MKTRNRIFAILLAFAMMITYMPALAFAEEIPNSEPAAAEDTLDSTENVEDTALEAAEEPAPDDEAVETEKVPEPETELEVPAAPAEEPNEGDGSGTANVKKFVPKKLKGETAVPTVEIGDDLLQAYVDKKVSDELRKASGKSFSKKPRNTNLEGAELNLYNALVPNITAVASGEASSTRFFVTVGEIFGDSAAAVYTAQDLGVDSLIDGDYISEEAMEAFFAIYGFDLNTTLNALLSDMPYELYWFDKTKGIAIEEENYPAAAVVYKDGEYYMCFDDEDGTPQYGIDFYVSGDYSANAYFDDETGEFHRGDLKTTTVNQELTGAAAAAAGNIFDIITEHEDEEDYDKLIAYKDEIAELTDYNEDAYENDPPYGDPWQLIHVFDGKANTKVVCEGYAKAFQYLCDNTDFDHAAIDCYTVSGDMGGDDATGAGPHMWNILHMEDGNNYIADITNSDGIVEAGSDPAVGYTTTVKDPDGSFLFLNGYTSGNVEDGYVYDCDGSSISYSYVTDLGNNEYDRTTLELFSEDELTISDEDYDPDWESGQGGDEESVEIDSVWFDGNKNGDGEGAEWAHFYSLDSKQDTISLNDMNVTIRDKDDNVIDPENYTLSVGRSWWDEQQQKECFEKVDDTERIGLAEVDEGSGFTEYIVTASAKEDSGYTGEVSGTFYVMDKHSLNFICSEVHYDNAIWSGEWRMHQHFKFSEEPGNITVKLASGNKSVLTEGADYTVTYYRRGESEEWDEIFNINDPIQGKPDEPGRYFARITGTGDYYGGNDVLIDVGELFLSGNGSPDLWSNEEREYTVVKSLGIADKTVNFTIGVHGEDPNDDWWNPSHWEEVLDNKDSDLPDDQTYYSYNESTGILTLHGENIYRKLGDRGLDIVAYVEKATDDVVFDFDYIYIREGHEIYNFEENRSVIPGQGGEVQGQERVRVRDSHHPDEEELWYEILNVEVEADENGLLSSLKRKDCEDGDGCYWRYEIKEAEELGNVRGTVALKVTYKDLRGAVQAYTFNIDVCNDVYEARMHSVNGSNNALPGGSLQLRAEGTHRYIREDENGRWEYFEDNKNLVYGWEIVDGEEFAEIDVNSTDSSSATLTFSPLSGTGGDDEDWFNEWVNVRLNVGSDTDQLTEGNVEGFHVASMYYEVWPAGAQVNAVNEDLDVSCSETYTFELRKYTVGKTNYEVMDDSIDVEYRFIDNDGSGRITAVQDKDDVRKFTFTRNSAENCGFEIEALWYEQGDQPGEPQNICKGYWYNSKNYDVWFESGSDRLYTDGYLDFVLNTDNLGSDWSDHYNIKFTVGQCEWDDDQTRRWTKKLNEEHFDYQVIDGKTVRLNGRNLTELLDQNVDILAEVKLNGTVLSEVDARAYVAEPWEENDFPENERTMLRGWDDHIDAHIGYRGGNGQYGDYDGEFTVNSVEVIDGDSVVAEPDNEGNGWSFRAVKNGDSIIKVSFTDEDGRSSLDSPYEFTVHVENDVFEVSLDSIDGKFRVGPGEDINLRAYALHKYTIDNDSGNDWRYEEDQKGLSYAWELEDESIATLEQDQSDPAKAVLRFHGEDELDEIPAGTKVTVKVMYDGKIVTETFDYYAVMDDYAWIEPRKINPTIDCKDAVVIDLETWLKEEGEDPRQVPGNISYTWSFNEGYGGVEIEEFVPADPSDPDSEDEYRRIGSDQTTKATRFRITRRTDGYTRIVLRADWGMGQNVWHAYYLDPKDYVIKLNGYDDRRPTITEGESKTFSYTVSGFSNDTSFDAVISIRDEEHDDWIDVKDLPDGAITLVKTEKGIDITLSDEVAGELLDRDIYDFHLMPTASKNGNPIWIEEGKPIHVRRADWQPDSAAVASDGEYYGDEEMTLYIEPGSKVFVAFVTDDEDNLDYGLAPIVGWNEPCDENGDPLVDGQGKPIGDLSGAGFGIKTMTAGEKYGGTNEFISANTYGIEIDPGDLPLGKSAELEYYLYEYDGDDWWSYFNSEAFSWDDLTIAKTKKLKVNVAGKIDFNNHGPENDPPLYYRKIKTYQMTVPDDALALGDVEFHAGAIGDNGFQPYIELKTNNYDNDYGNYDTGTKKLTLNGQSIYEDEHYADLYPNPMGDGRNLHIRAYIKNEDNEIVAFGHANCLIKGPCAEGNDVAGKPVRENVADATCIAEGSFDEVVYCDVCGKELSRETKVIAKKAHTLVKTEAKDATCTTDGNSAYWTCSVCHKHFSDAAGTEETEEGSWVIGALDHDWNSEGTITTRATATTEGLMTYTCNRDGSHTKSEPIAPLGVNHVPVNEAAEAAIAAVDEAATVEAAEAAAATAEREAGTAVENAESALENAKSALEAAQESGDEGAIAEEQAKVNAAEQDVRDAEATQAKAKAVAASIKAKKSANSATAAQNAAAAQASAGTDAAVNAALNSVAAANTAKTDADNAVRAAQTAVMAANATGDEAAIAAANTALTNAEGAQRAASAAVITANNTYGTAVATRNAAIAAAQVPVEILDLPAVKISKPASAKKKLTVKWKKVSKKNLKKISGIQIQVATDPGFTNIVKTATAGKKKTSKKIGGLQAKTKYYVRIRAYGAANHYSVWKSKNGKTK